MRVAVVGAGGVGGYFGALLARAGHEVALLARGEHLRAIRERGLLVEALAGSFTVRPQVATDDPAEAGPADLALLCVKTYALERALAELGPLLTPRTLVLTLQNGVEAPEIAAAALGAERILAGVAYCELTLRAPGVIAQGSPIQRILLGPHTRALTPAAERAAAALREAGIDAQLSADPRPALWAKCCFICAMSGVTTLARRPLGALLADAESRALLEAAMREARAVAEALGVTFASDPVAAGMATAAGFPPSAKSSMLRDLEAGRPLEVEALNGALVRIGRRVGVATPVNQAIYAALRLAQPGGGDGA